MRKKEKVDRETEREVDTWNCFKCELCRVRGLRNEEKLLIVSHEVSLAPVKSEPATIQWRIPQNSRALCVQTGWRKEEAKKSYDYKASLRLKIFLIRPMELISMTFLICRTLILGYIATLLPLRLFN